MQDDTFSSKYHCSYIPQIRIYSSVINLIESIFSFSYDFFFDLILSVAPEQLL